MNVVPLVLQAFRVFLVLEVHLVKQENLEKEVFMVNKELQELLVQEANVVSQVKVVL